MRAQGVPVAEPAPQLHFLRFEFKYVLDQRTRERVERELLPYLSLDPHVARQPEQQYFVRSLYFDDPVRSAFRAKQDGLVVRAKFRLRTYTRDPAVAAPRFLEIKGRYNDLVWKHRAPVLAPLDPRARGDLLCRGLLAHTAPGDVRDRFEFARIRRRVEPIVLVDYQRRPYESPFDPDFRVTFDHDLAATATNCLFPNGLFPNSLSPNRPEVTTHRELLRGHTVMEVKFRRALPAWFHRVVHTHQLRRRSVSKVTTAMLALGFAPALAPFS